MSLLLLQQEEKKWCPDTPDTKISRPTSPAKIVEVESTIVQVTFLDGLDPELPKPTRPARPLAPVELAPPNAAIEAGFAPELPRPSPTPRPSTTLFEVEPSRHSGSDDLGTEPPRSARPARQPALVESAPLNTTIEAGFNPEQPRPRPTPRPPTTLFEVESTRPSGSDDLGTEPPRSARPTRPLALVEFAPPNAVIEAGFDPEQPRPSPAPRPPTTLLEVEPSRPSGSDDLGVESPRSARPARPLALVESAPPNAVIEAGFDPEQPRPSPTPRPPTTLFEVEPSRPSESDDLEAEPPRTTRPARPLISLTDVFGNIVSPSSATWELDITSLPRSPDNKIILLDDWQPPLEIPNQVLPGSYKPWSIFEERREDLDFINRVEKNIQNIDDELIALILADDEEIPYEETTTDPIPDDTSSEPIILSPGWRAGQDRAKRQRAECPRVRHVHYNFASDLDFGIRRRIVGILERAEQRGIDIFGSDAFRMSETIQIGNQLVPRGMNAWILKLTNQSRLELAREAIAQGFRLVTFDATSLSLIHQPRSPWKPILLGVGAGTLIGYLIWGHKPKK